MEPEQLDYFDHEITCTRGNRYRVRLPRGQEHHWITWGDRPRVCWDCKTSKKKKHGIEVSRGPEGILVVDGDGDRHFVQHGDYKLLRVGSGMPTGGLIKSLSGAVSDLARMLKGEYPAPKPGSRWITVHPNGPGTKGTPILLEPTGERAGDGKHVYRVVGGGGGRMHHLRMEMRPESAEDRKRWRDESDKRRKRREQTIAALPADAQKDVKARRAALRDAKRQAEDTLVARVRATIGGVSEDLDPAVLDGKSEGAQARLLAQHRRRQVREATRRVREAEEFLVDDTGRKMHEAAILQASMEAEPEVLDVARSLAQDEIELRTEEAEERRRDRALTRERRPEVQDSSDAAAAEAAKRYGDMHDPARDVARWQSRPGAESAALADAYQELADGYELTKLADGNTDGLDLDVLARKADREGWSVSSEDLRQWEHIDEGERERAADQARKEAARKLRRHEVLLDRADRIADIAEGKGEDVAQEALTNIRLEAEIAGDVREAKRLGLGESLTPMQAVEVSEALALIKDASRLRDVRRAYRDAVKDIEAGKYDESRRAFELPTTLTTTEAIEQATAAAADRIRDQLTQKLTGLADVRSNPLQQAVAAGHHAGLADVTLDLTKQQYLDRMVVDAIGARNAAHLLRWALEADGIEPAVMLSALEQTHVAAVDQLTRDALARADQLVPDLVDAVTDLDSIETALASVDVNRRDLHDAQRAIGSALGKLEATATLTQAFRTPDHERPSRLEIPISAGGRDGTTRYLHALGLAPGDYEFVAADGGPGRFVLPQSAWGRLVNRLGADEVERRRTIDAVKRGDMDEDDWMPDGLVTRTATSFSDPVAQPAQYSAALELPADAAGYADTVRDHVAARLAEGMPAAMVQGDLLSPSVLDAAPDREAYVQAVKDALPFIALEQLHPEWTAGDLTVREVDGQVVAEGPEGLVALPDGLSAQEARAHLNASASWTQRATEIDRDTYERMQAEGGPVRTRPRTDDEMRPHLDAMVADWAKRTYGTESVGLQAQQIDLDDARTQEALHRALAQHPTAHVAFKDPAHLTSADRRHLREYFHDRMGIDKRDRYNKAEYDRRMLAIGPEPERDRPAAMLGLFGSSYDDPINPAWREWEQQTRKLRREYPQLALETELAANPEPTVTAAERDAWSADRKSAFAKRHAEWTEEVAATRKRATKGLTAWAKYIDAHGDRERAIAALQGEMRGLYLRKFADSYGRLSDVGLYRGAALLPSGEAHVQATAGPEKLAAMRQRRQEAYARLRDRDTGGRYATEQDALLDKLERQQARDRTEAAQQVGMFGATPMEEAADSTLYTPSLPTVEPGDGERLTLGDRVEKQIGSVVGRLAEPFRGRRVDLFPGASMSGKRVAQQRAVKQAGLNSDTIGLFHGTGTGKTAEMLGIGAQSMAQGRTTRTIITTPVAVARQFSQEALAFTEPGKYRISVAGDLDHGGRLAALRGDGGPGFHVFTHETLRDTGVRMIADHLFNGDVERAKAEMRGADRKQAATWMADAMAANDIDDQFLPMVDEAHKATTRQGTPDSLFNVVVRAFGDNAPGRVAATATANKNDSSEVGSMFSFLDPSVDEGAFARNLSADPEHNANYLRRHFSHLYSTAKIDPQGVAQEQLHNPQVVEGRVVAGKGPLAPSEWQSREINRVTSLFDRVRSARQEGRVDVEALKALSPSSFEGVPDDQHEDVATRLATSAAMARDRAYDAVLRRAPYEHNPMLQNLVSVAKHKLTSGTRTVKSKASGTRNEVQGARGVFFADRLATARHVAEALTKHGDMRIGVYHGGLSQDEREEMLGQIKAGELDGLVATSAAEAGINLHALQYSVNLDVPMTEKSNTQRQGRVYRQKQLDDVDSMHMHYDHALDVRARQRLRRKAGLQSVFGDPHDHLDDTGVSSRYQAELAMRHQTKDGYAA